MKKILLSSILLSTALLADNSLGTPITNDVQRDKLMEQKRVLEQKIAKLENKSHQKGSIQKPLTTKVPNKLKKSFRKDHHRYDKRYSNFDYENNGYYNDDGYYYGYYDRDGYFYNNIFFTYNRTYTYSDRRYRRGYFSHRHHHYRPYVYHRFNNWNRVHCYREPNRIVYGHYYDRSYYPQYGRDNFGNRYYSNEARMSSYSSYNHQNYTQRGHYNNQRNYNHNTTRMNSRYTNSYSRSHTTHQNQSRMSVSR